MIRKKLRASPSPSLPKKPASNGIAPFIEHLHELRRRLFFVAVTLTAFSVAAYSVQQTVVRLLLAPSHGQHFIYTSPLGGLNFLIKVCLLVGIVCSIPVIVYQFLRYVEPLMREPSRHFIRWGTFVSGVLAVLGMAFGYFLGLPAALEFLLNQFTTAQIQPLLTIEAYLSFVSVYMLCAALMFQIPLIVLFINRIKPLTPGGLLRMERWVILFSVILAFIMNPTPNLISQFLIAIPMILTYQLAIGIIWWQSRGSRPKLGAPLPESQPLAVPGEPRNILPPPLPVQRTYIDGIIPPSHVGSES